jgi:hypothetical protein
MNLKEVRKMAGFVFITENYITPMEPIQIMGVHMEPILEAGGE